MLESILVWHVRGRGLIMTALNERGLPQEVSGRICEGVWWSRPVAGTGSVEGLPPLLSADDDLLDAVILRRAFSALPRANVN